MSIRSAALLEAPIERFPQATVAAFDPTEGSLPRRSLDTKRTVAFVERLAELNVPGILIAASTGHGHLRTVEEMEAWFRCVASADLKDTTPMALLRPEDGEEANEKLLDLLVELGYPVVFFRPGTGLGSEADDKQIVEELQPYVALAAKRDLAIGLYSIPDVSGVRLSAEAAAALVDSLGGDHIVAVKVTEADYETSTLEFLKNSRLAHLKIVQGWDPHLARALQDGPQYDASGRQRCGVTSGPMSLAVYQYLHIFKCASEGDWDEVAAAQQSVTTLFASMQDDPRKFADLQRAKYVMGLGHPLIGEVQPEQVERLFTALEALPRRADQQRLARSLDLMQDGPFHDRLAQLSGD